MTTLLLVRHGSTEWNLGRRLQGRTDVELSDLGKEQVRAIAPHVMKWQPQTLISSPLARARSTAETLWSLPARIDDRWVEHGLGEWEGRTHLELGADYERWRAGELIPPGGESAAAIRERVRTAVHDAIREPGPVLIVTHGGTIRAVLQHVAGISPASIVPVQPASLTVLEVGLDGVGRLRQFNIQGRASHDGDHLRHDDLGDEPQREEG